MTPPRPDWSGLADDELIRLVRGGETDAFAEIVRRTRRPAYGLARRITRNHEDADDAVQESYVKAFRALDRFEVGRAIGPWLLTIVARTALSRVRQGKRRAAHSLDEPASEGAMAASDRVADPGADPAGFEGSWDVERAFARLSSEHQQVLALRVEGDLTYAAIAEALGIPVGTVMSRLARAREALVEQMSETRKVGSDDP